MVLLTSILYTILAFLGFRDHPHSSPTELSGAASCRGLEANDGSVSCFKDGGKTVCHVICDDKYQGDFTCTKDEGWTPELPKCVKPIEDKNDSEYAEQVAESGGCPDEAKCSELCRQKGRKDGRCLGPNRITCFCRVG